MSGEHLTRTVANTIAAVHLSWNGYNKKPADLYQAMAKRLVDAQLVQSPETAAETDRLRKRVAELEGLLEAPGRDADEDPIAYALTDMAELPAVDDVTPKVQKRRALFAGQRAVVEDPHDGPLHHDYRVDRDLPRVGGVR